MTTFIDANDLATALHEQCSATAIIAIDGWTGCGKSTLAAFVANQIGALHFDLDSALCRDQGSYVPSINLDSVKAALESVQSRAVVSGICSLQIFQAAGIPVECHIYIKRMATWGWADEDELQGCLPEFSGSSGEALRSELRKYHRLWLPHITAHHEFHRSG